MKVLINALSARLGGGITVLRNLMPALADVDGGAHEYTVLGRAETRESFRFDSSHVTVTTSPFAERSGATRLGWEQLVLPTQLALDQADVLFSPANLAVLACPKPQVLMFQNMAPFDDDVLARTDGSRRLRLRALRTLGDVSARAADRVVFISDFARREISSQLRIPASKCSRAYLGRDPAFTPAAKGSAAPILEKLGVRGRYLLSVSQFYHYKNFTELVVGFARALPGLPSDVKLVIAGAEHERDYADAVRATIARERVGDRVVLAGQVPYAQLPGLYASAELFLFPSTCENFPNILVEGLASGVPTLSSGLGPMPEIAGEGAMYFDPFTPDEIAALILRHWHDSSASRALAERGIAQAARYSWQATARALLTAFEEAAAR
ncbi:MAG: glycosyltransferase family 4 protein [Deltaproteobacteria bacterium]|nr:glycosyltransferase family 4 protein [Deltaproteobacteria bacterium]